MKNNQVPRSNGFCEADIIEAWKFFQEKKHEEKHISEFDLELIQQRWEALLRHLKEPRIDPARMYIGLN